MKIRLGFVSNSSGTSFCIAGVQINDEQERIIEEKVGDIWHACQKAGLETYQQECSERYVGLSIHQMMDAETKTQFLQRAQKKLTDTFGIRDEASILTDGWYDG